LIEQSTSISRVSASSPVALSFTLPYRRFSTCKPTEIGRKEASSLAGLLLLILGIVSSQAGVQAKPVPPYGLASRPAAQPYLGMPTSDRQAPPRLLSQTGAFKNPRDLIPVDSLIPYDINVPFYSDGAVKSRWASIPSEGPATNPCVRFAATGEWQFPSGTVFVKHFEMVTDETRPDLKRRLETRLLVRTAEGGVYGATYKWRADNSDAELLTSNLTETLSIRTATGFRTQTWYYPSRRDCKTCHTSTAGGVLGLKTRQMNRDFRFPSGVVDNQLRSWNHIGLFEPELQEKDLAGYAKLAPADDLTRSLDDRARSYLDANCAYCHRPGGTVAYFDARYDTPHERQNLVNGSVLIDEGLDKARVIAPNDIWRSVTLLRASSLEGLKMPPLAHETLDHQGLNLLREWIQSLPGKKVLPPPEFSLRGGKFQAPIEVALHHLEPGTEIRYTTDGSAPTLSDPVYREPLHVSESTTVRAKAFKPGFVKSITAQETFVLPVKP
jgi:uncharacterized repeat protein (TIGR03806 family)